MKSIQKFLHNDQAAFVVAGGQRTISLACQCGTRIYLIWQLTHNMLKTATMRDNISQHAKGGGLAQICDVTAFASGFTFARHFHPRPWRRRRRSVQMCAAFGVEPIPTLLKKYSLARLFYSKGTIFND